MLEIDEWLADHEGGEDDSHDPEPAWLLLGVEDVESSEECRAAGCGERISPVDVFCPNVNHGDLLLFQDAPAGRARWWLVNLARTIVVALVVLAAAHETRWPIYLLAVAAGLACIGLPLHAHRLGRVVGLAGWAVICAASGAVAAARPDADGMRLVWTVAVGAPVAFAAVQAVLGPVLLTRWEPGGVEREAARGVAGSYLMAGVAAATWWLTSGRLADHFVTVPEALQRWLAFSALGVLLGSLLIAAVGALLASFGEVDLDVPPRIDLDKLHRRDPVRWGLDDDPQPPPEIAGRSGGVAGGRGRVGAQIGAVLRQLEYQLKRSTQALARQIANGLIAFGHAARRAACRLVNWADRRARIFGRRVKFVFERGRQIAGIGAGYAVRVVGRGGRPLVAYGAGVAGAAAALALASGYTHYLVDGPLGELAAGAGWSVAGVAACFVAWAPLAHVRLRDAVRAQLRFLSRVAPDLAVFTVAAGWVVGVPGTLGYGPIRVGWVTVVGTAVLAVLLAQEELSDRRAKATGDTVAPDPL